MVIIGLYSIIVVYSRENENYGDFIAIEGNKNNIIIHYIEEESCVIV